MRCLNRVTLMGNLASDPEVIETSTGKTKTTFPLATNVSKKGDKEFTDFHRVAAWQKLGEICGNYLKKGSGVYLEGQLKNRSYETKKGEKKYITEIVADNIHILSWKKGDEGEPNAELTPLNEDEDSEK